MTTFAKDKLPSGFESKFVEANDQRLHYVIGGTGDPIVLLHGYPETWYEWRKLMPLLSGHHTVIAFDLRGFGESSVPKSGYEKSTLAKDIHAAVKKLGYDRVALVGHDWGGPVAYAYAAQFRESVDKLVVIEGAPFGPWTKNPNLFWFFDFFRLPNYAEQVLPGREKEFLTYFYRNDKFHLVPEAFDDETVKVYIDAYSRKGRMEAGYELYRAIDTDIKENAEFAKNPLTLPVLAIGAEAGGAEHIAEFMKNTASNVTAQVFLKTGHFIPEERPELLATQIELFVSGKPIEATVSPGS